MNGNNKGLGVYINAGYGKKMSRPPFLQNVTQNGGTSGRGYLITHREKQIYLFSCDLALSLLRNKLPT